MTELLRELHLTSKIASIRSIPEGSYTNLRLLANPLSELLHPKSCHISVINDPCVVVRWCRKSEWSLPSQTLEQQHRISSDNNESETITPSPCGACEAGTTLTQTTMNGRKWALVWRRAPTQLALRRDLPCIGEVLYGPGQVRGKVSWTSSWFNFPFLFWY